MKLMDVFGITDVGCVRTGNEDCFLIQPLGGEKNPLNQTVLVNELPENGLLLAVSDGMGGAAAGEVASSLALMSLNHHLFQELEQLEKPTPDDWVKLLETGVQFANQEVSRTAMNNHNQRGMGATITVMLVYRDVGYFFQVGDSRAFVLRDQIFCPVTRDQSFVGQLVEMGTITPSQAAKHPQRNVILQALGTQEKLKVDVSFLPLCKGDIVLLSSDGLHSEIDETAIRNLSLNARQQKKTIKEMVESLLDAAKKSGGQDNITIIGMRCGDGFPERQPGEDPGLFPYPFLELDNPHSRSFRL